jgi:hypothetical protein
MVSYKRNQVEQAISGVLEPQGGEPTTELRTRLKRLLETDRALGREPSSNGAHYAFFSADAPGSGIEVWFSDYEAFALLNGIRLMAHGWPQGFAVSVMRQVRPELKKEHARILKLEASELFDQEAIRRNAKEGDMAFDVTDPVLLAIVSKSGAATSSSLEPHACAICRGQSELAKFHRSVAGGAGAYTAFEVAAVAHSLAKALSLTEPSRRGRGL